MKISERAVRHPVATFMLFVGVLFVGIISFGEVGLELFPDISLPTAVIFTVYPGVGPYEVESRVTKPLEEAVSTMAGLDSLTC